MASADFIIAAFPFAGVTLGVSYDTVSLGISQIWAQNDAAPVDMNISIGPRTVTVPLPAGRTVQAVPVGLAMQQSATAPGAQNGVILPLTVNVRVPA